MTDLQSVIDMAFENRAGISPKTAEPGLKEAVAEVIAQLGLYWLIVNEPPPPRRILTESKKE